MKKHLFLYLFIIAVLMNLFTYKYFTSKDAAQQKTEVVAKEEKVDSLASNQNITSDGEVFSLENNDRAQNYLYETAKINDIPAFSEKVKQALFAYNDSPEGNKYVDQIKMGEQKFIINSMKIINHRWIIADYSNGQLWGEVLLKYFVEDNGSISFEVMNSYLYPVSLN